MTLWWHLATLIGLLKRPLRDIEFARRCKSNRGKWRTNVSLSSCGAAGGGHRSAYRWDLWNIKYLHGFKWDNLTEEIGECLVIASAEEDWKRSCVMVCPCYVPHAVLQY